MVSELDNLITEHSDLTRDLVQQLRELGDMRHRVISDQAHAWLSSADLGVTERRETVRYSTANLEAEVQVQLAEIEAIRAHLEDVKLRIRYATDLATGLIHGGT